MTTTVVSQELFDETLLENEEVFELSEQEALEETIQQLTKLSTNTNAGTANALSHLCLNHPNSKEGKEQRQEQSDFLHYLKVLDECVDTSGSIVFSDNCPHDEVLNALRGIRTRCTSKEDTERFLLLLQQHQAMYTFMSFMGVVSNKDQSIEADRVQVLDETLQTLRCILLSKKEFRDAFCAWDRWRMLFLELFVDNVEIKIQLIGLATAACKNSEANKVQWMRSNKDGGIRVLLRGLEQGEENKTSDLMVESCRLVMVLCRYDDFSAPSTKAPTVSSAHDHVLEFARAGAVPVLVNLLQQQSTQQDSILTCACLSALRVLAIQDDIVQTMVATGLLDTAQTVLTQTEDQLVATAALGLLRNLSANDEIKTTLLSSLPSICARMEQYPQDGLLQQHGCGTLAAMALRKPRNAVVIVQHDGHVRILQAMRLHPNVVALQRLGALAIRNICSRQSDDTIQQALLDLGAEQVLREIAGKHQGSVDEAYAALRDLGCSVSLLTVKDDGSTTTTGRTAMFGEVQTTFRPVFEESEELAGIEL